MKQRVDVAVIGAGTAGLSACKEIQKTTNNFVLINHGSYGTTCVLSGCMPTKILGYTANLYHQRQSMAQFGICGTEALTINIKLVLQHVRAMREYFLSNIMDSVEKLRPHLLQGFAHFISPNIVRINNRIIEADKIIIATGSTPIIPQEWHEFNDLILTSNSIFEQEDLPHTIAVIGLSILGVEMAQTLSRIGLNVTAIGADDHIGTLTDPEVNAYAISSFHEEIPLWLGHKATITREGQRLRVTAGDKTVLVDKIFAALGRKPNITHMGLEALGIIKPDGTIDYNPQTMRIKNFPLYIAGDVKHSVLYEADDEGKIAGYNATRAHEMSFKRRIKLRITHTSPEIAVIGKSWAELIPSFIVTGETTFDNQGTARIIAQNKGIIRIYGDKKTGLLLGAELFAPYGDHLAHLLAWVIEMKLTAYDVLKLPFYHPTAEEALRTALHNMASKIVTVKKTSVKAREEEIA
jgi:dihydrolipoamide dehydrogenase